MFNHQGLTCCTYTFRLIPYSRINFCWKYFICPLKTDGIVSHRLFSKKTEILLSQLLELWHSADKTNSHYIYDQLHRAWKNLI